MIGAIIPKAYDFEGSKTLIPVRKAMPIFRPTFPMGRFVAAPIGVRCSDLHEVRRFLATCAYRSDEDQFGQPDYWQPPDQFEQTRAGDCEDFALWAWRQLMALGLQTRFVVGFSGRYGDGHAWLHVVYEGKQCIVEPQLYWLESPIPRLSTLRFRPEISVQWFGNRLHYFKHSRPTFDFKFVELPGLLGEWVGTWGPVWPKLGLALLRKVTSVLFRTSTQGSHTQA